MFCPSETFDLNVHQSVGQLSPADVYFHERAIKKINNRSDSGLFSTIYYSTIFRMIKYITVLRICFYLKVF